jgi:hypothetical protein
LCHRQNAHIDAFYISATGYKVYPKKQIGIGSGHDVILSAYRDRLLKKYNGITGILNIMTRHCYPVPSLQTSDFSGHPPGFPTPGGRHRPVRCLLAVMAMEGYTGAGRFR